ncbi:hypothetical protein BJ508DRAFT_6793 [Ascobolus immersus RN42]|uniref:Uncharacterized protein n=1 Tax=Ascobolus immersus RN42 TaxID=1160509 RepID=A0A3N4IGP0_ASCIM|nr:hypothetical protein BJ508DRAFT_6793 [Ascobolus immersus RN42]
MGYVDYTEGLMKTPIYELHVPFSYCCTYNCCRANDVHCFSFCTYPFSYFYHFFVLGFLSDYRSYGLHYRRIFAPSLGIWIFFHGVLSVSSLTTLFQVTVQFIPVSSWHFLHLTPRRPFSEVWLSNLGSPRHSDILLYCIYSYLSLPRGGPHYPYLTKWKCKIVRHTFATVTRRSLVHFSKLL